MLNKKGHIEIEVTNKMSAASMGSGLLDVYATPCMIALMEETCWRSILDDLKEGESTVGTRLDVKHLAATPIGMKVYCDSELIEVDRKRLVFKVVASDERGKIGEGIHERFIVDIKKFQEKINNK
ncbi:thioesterase family protein [Peptoniphilaceae bacterium SGI.131]